MFRRPKYSKIHNFKFDNKKTKIIKDQNNFYSKCRVQPRNQNTPEIWKGSNEGTEKGHQVSGCGPGDQVKIICTTIFLINMYGCESWRAKKPDGKIMHLKCDTGGELYKYDGPPERQINGFQITSCSHYP